MKDPIEILPPSRNRILVGLRVECSRHRMSFTLAGDLPLDFSHGPAIKTIILSGDPVYTHCWFDLRGQLLDRPEHGMAEVI